MLPAFTKSEALKFLLCDNKRHWQDIVQLRLVLTRFVSGCIDIHRRVCVSVFVSLGMFGTECGVSRVTAPNCPGVWLFIPHRSGICWQTKASKSGGVLSVRSHLMGPLQTLETVSLANIYPSYGLTGSNNHMSDFIWVPCYFSSPLVVKRVLANIVEKNVKLLWDVTSKPS